MTKDTNTELDIVYSFLKDAKQYGLEAEVILWALKYMKKHPEAKTEEAMAYGYYEWIK